MKVKLEHIIEEIEFSNCSDDYNYFFDKKNQEVVRVSDDIFRILDYENEKEIERLKNRNNVESQELEIAELILGDNEDRFIKFLSKYDINEYNIMEEFIETVENATMYNKLINSIEGKGAFRNFKNTCNYLGIIKKWYDFREEYFKKLAIKWCESNNIEYEE